MLKMMETSYIAPSGHATFSETIRGNVGTDDRSLLDSGVRTSLVFYLTPTNTFESPSHRVRPPATSVLAFLHVVRSPESHDLIICI